LPKEITVNLHKRVLEAKNTMARGSQILRALAQAGGLLGIALGSALPVIATGQISGATAKPVSPGLLLAQNEPEDAPPPPPPPPPPEEPPSEIPPPVDEPSAPGANRGSQPPQRGGNAPGRPGAAAPGAPGGAIPVDPSGIPAKKIPPGEELVTIDFPEPIPIKDIIKAVAQWTGKNFILGQGVSSSARVAIISPQQVTKEEAYQAFLSALNVAGFTTVDTGRMVKIIPTRQATSSNIKTFYGASWAPMTDEIITQIIPLTYIDAQTVATQLKSILRESNAVPFPTTNSLIVSDTGHKIRRLLEIILLLDVKGNQPQVAIVPILYMDAADVAKKIQDIFGRGGAKAGGSLYLQKVIIDERSNSTILIGPPRGLDDVVRLIKRLDRPLEDQSQQAQIHVRPLEYADATKLAGTLQALAQGSADNRAGALRARARAGNPPGAPGAPGARPGEGDPISVADLGNVKITADSPTNSLIIQGSTAAFKEIDNIIRMLDRRKSQVFVEADIIDVNVGKNLNISGSGFAGFSDSNFVYPFGWQPATAAGFSALSAGGAASSAQASTLISGLGPQAVFGVLSKQSITIGDNLKLTPGAFIFALKKDTNSNVLQTPSMLVADNEDAEFVATERENIFTLQSNATSGISGQKIENIDAELSLKIKPQVSKADIVNMDLGLKADTFGRRSADGRPEQTLKRAFSTKVSVQDGQTIVISGLQRDIEIEGQAKVPLLGDIPIIGWLFRNSDKTRQKTNLMIFLTPYVVRDASDLSRIYDKKMRDQEEFLQKFYGEDYRDRDVFKRMPNRSDGRVPPPRVSKESTGSSEPAASGSDPKSPASPADTGAPAAGGDNRKVESITDEQNDAGIALPSRDPDPIVVPGSEALGGGGGGGDFGGSAAPPPPPPPPPPPGGEGDQGGGE
jgi:general secretion pathway protein D